MEGTVKDCGTYDEHGYPEFEVAYQSRSVNSFSDFESYSITGHVRRVVDIPAETLKKMIKHGIICNSKQLRAAFLEIPRFSPRQWYKRSARVNGRGCVHRFDLGSIALRSSKSKFSHPQGVFRISAKS